MHSEGIRMCRLLGIEIQELINNVHVVVFL